jgi:hypothetical protein
VIGEQGAGGRHEYELRQFDDPNPGKYLHHASALAPNACYGFF